MPPSRCVVPADLPALRDGLLALRHELEVPGEHPASVVRAATKAAERLDATDSSDRQDLRELPFVTIDPPHSRDLDQALHLADLGGGATRVHYAIADVGAFVRPGSKVDDEARRRGVTTYLPDGNAPLYPDVLAEGAASLLPDVDRPAVVYVVDLDASGAITAHDVVLAMVRSQRKLGYAQAQDLLDRRADPMLRLLERVGRVRAEQEWRRGGVTLPLPDQEFDRTPDGFVLRWRRSRPVERHNAQLSLLAGHVGALRLLERGAGVLRTLPPPRPRRLAQLRELAAALGVPWPSSVSYPDFMRTLDPGIDEHLAVAHEAPRLLAGAGYHVLGPGDATRVRRDGAGWTDGVREDDDAPVLLHHALAMPYAHVTAPLRRLVDRFNNDLLVGRLAPDELPVADLEEVVEALSRGRRRAGEADRAVTTLAENLVLAEQRGRRLDAVVVGTGRDRLRVHLREVPAIVDVAVDDAAVASHRPGDAVVVEVAPEPAVGAALRLATVAARSGADGPATGGVDEDPATGSVGAIELTDVASALAPLRDVVTSPAAGSLVQVAEQVGLDIDVARRLLRAGGRDLAAPTARDAEWLAIGARLASVLPVDALERAIRTRTRAIHTIVANDLTISNAVLTRRLLDEGRDLEDVVAGLIDAVEALNPLIRASLGNEYEAALDRFLRLDAIERMLPSGGSELEAAAGFVDIVGWTRLSASTDPAGVNEVLAEFESHVDDLVGGCEDVLLAKYIGDAVMLISSEPSQLLGVLHGLVASDRARNAIAPRRAGAALGTITARDGDYVGPTVNLAARLTDLARAASVVVAPRFADAIGQDWDRSRLPPTRVKGLGTMRPLRVRPVEVDADAPKR